MALYVIGDLHLSLKSNKPMDVFGSGWKDYVNRISEGFSGLNDDDVTVLCGDNSWGMDLNEAEDDLIFIDRLPGKKIMLKGNHDYWWSTASKMRVFFEEKGIKTLDILHNNCHFFNELAICGTRGWFEGEGDRKVFDRELIRLRTSLAAAGAREKLCFLHYPPRYAGGGENEFTQLMREFGVKRCYYGHLHAEGHRQAENGERGGIEYRLIAADYLGFKPMKITD